VRYDEEGLAGLIDHRLEQVSQHKAPVAECTSSDWALRVQAKRLNGGVCRVATHFATSI